ncbi:hypothetical protein H012_gp210 [Acanthamoeba polyphaga moumouvirus]|uniref:Ubiquitin-like domain-containing protein n=1 Tax=Acanthamoeba polyphaga moumouvirus TaxID=1269028 RepID=L7RD18_9VIRU|nr:hypothetical protein H012_gp210 [Acanthamoeba polyphaga moumouvirus]AGC02242.1 hypothetical protein Moumou_00721 [Acanthamoeba polyphaga moumouvirus]
MENDIIKIFVFHKSKLHYLDVCPNIKISDLKEKISKITSLIPNDQKIGIISDHNYTNGKQRFFVLSQNDKDTIKSIGLASGDRVYVMDKKLFN